MATTVTLTQINAAFANRQVTFLATVANTGASSLTLNSLSVSEQTGMGANIEQPNILTTNAAVGVGNPSIAAGGSSHFSFHVQFPSPNGPGPSPNAPGGAAGVFIGQPAQSSARLVAVAQTSDGSVASSVLVVPVLSATSPFPVPEGGALQFSQGSNLINGIITGVL